MAEEYLTDDEQLEAVKHAFKEYAPWILGGIILGVGGWYGYQRYQSHKNEVALRAADQFRPDLVLVSAGFDSRFGDPLGRFTLSDQDFADLTRVMLEIADKHAGGRLVYERS